MLNNLETCFGVGFFRLTDLLIKNEKINLMEASYCRSAPFFALIFIVYEESN